MSNYRILLVDDEAPQRKMLAGYLRKKNYEVLESDRGSIALDLLKRESLDLVLTDQRMPEMSGLELLSEIKRINPLIEVIVMTAYGSIDTAVEAMQKGAYTFLTKPVDLEPLSVHLQRALERKHLYEENLELRARLGETRFKGIIAQSEEMRRVLGLVARVATARASVLIIGESGTGKEMVARAIHDASTRKDAPFIPVNIAAIPETLIENELFGHEKGSFTGAIARHLGKFERARGGTLFIDEIGDMPLVAQVKLLRVLQEGKIERVGGSAAIEIDVRVIAATHRNMEQEIREKRFREDLYYRLNVVRIHLPPLRERKADIPPLVDHFLKHYSSINSKTIAGVDPLAMDLLMKQTWNGNVRELENALESAVVLCRGQVILPEDLPLQVRSEIHPKTCGYFPGDDSTLPLFDRLENFEKHEVMKALKAAGGNRSEAARMLGMSEKNIRDRLKRWEV